MRNACMAVITLMTGLPLAAQAEDKPNRITVLVDAFSDRPDLRKDWGYSALVEYSGRRILFDTGNDSELFRINVEVLGIDLRNLDAVVISHRHGDHSDGLRYLLGINPSVVIYVPDDEYFSGPTPRRFFENSVDTLPPRMRYFDGRLPALLPHGSPWKDAKLHQVSSSLEIFPGIRVVRNISAGESFTETPGLSLVIDTPTGQILLVGCSHPGIEQILESVGDTPHSFRLIMGGLHWLTLPDSDLSRMFGSRYLYAGLGSAVELE